MNRRHFLTLTASALAAGSAARSFAADAPPGFIGKVEKTPEQWRVLLTPAQFDVLREEGTERPYSSALNDEHRTGTFACAGCALPLFASSTKFDSHTGWPSFWQPLDHAVASHVDTSYGVVRKEIHCRRCGGHQGHVFDDGPAPTGLRYCMNGVAMTFTAA